MVVVAGIMYMIPLALIALVLYPFINKIINKVNEDNLKSDIKINKIKEEKEKK